MFVFSKRGGPLQLLQGAVGRGGFCQWPIFLVATRLNPVLPPAATQTPRPENAVMTTQTGTNADLAPNAMLYNHSEPASSPPRHRPATPDCLQPTRKTPEPAANRPPHPVSDESARKVERDDRDRWRVLPPVPAGQASMQATGARGPATRSRPFLENSATLAILPPDGGRQILSLYRGNADGGPRRLDLRRSFLAPITAPAVAQVAVAQAPVVDDPVAVVGARD